MPFLLIPQECGHLEGTPNARKIPRGPKNGQTLRAIQETCQAQNASFLQEFVNRDGDWIQALRGNQQQKCEFTPKNAGNDMMQALKN